MNITEIAKLCGVSPSTVSKILNKKDEHISAKTRQHVLAIINEYQYVPYSKVLHGGIKKTGLIGVVAQQGDNKRGNQLFQDVEKELAEKGYYIVPVRVEEKNNRKALAILENKGVEGIVSLFTEGILEATGLPQVSIGLSPMDTIYYNLEEAAWLATNYLLERKHQRIACVFSEGQEQVTAGYSKAFHQHNISFSKTVFYPYQDINEIVDSSFWQDEETFTGIVCDKAESAFFLYQNLQNQGISIPNDLSIICLEEEHLAELLRPSLTTVGLIRGQLASQVADAVVCQIEKRKREADTIDQIKFKVNERNSVDWCHQDYQKRKILVVGSMNMDFVILLNQLPEEGETVVSESIHTLPGGKGANQAVGVAKLGAPSYIIGCVGKDREGREIYNKLMVGGVKTEAVVFRSSEPTGKAYINVSKTGESMITVYSGANAKLSQRRIRKYGYLFKEAEYCLLSLEIPEEAVRQTLQLCRENKVKVILKPAPANMMKEDFYPLIDYFVPNEKEINQLFADSRGLALAEKVSVLLDKGIENVIVTLGANGCYLRNQVYDTYFPAADFRVADTTGAADAFISALAVYLREGMALPIAIGYATYAGGISVTRMGVQDAMTNRVGLEIYRDKIYREFFYKESN